MAGSRGGFSNADIKVMFETNASIVNEALVKLDSTLSNIGNSFNKLTKQIDKNDLAQKKLQHTTRASITRMRDWMIVIGQARAAFLNIKMLTLDTVGAIAKVNSKFERLNILLGGLSKENDPTKKLKEVNSNLKYLINLSKNAPYSLGTLQDAFVKLQTVGLEPAKGSLQALVDAVSAFGGDDAAIQRSAVALQQMAGKGVVSMEELRQQLGEAVPTALQMMAQGANMSLKDFTKAVSTGTVEAISAIKAMNREFALSYGGASKNLMNTYEGMISKMKTNWDLFILEMGESSGLYDTIKDQVKAISEFLESPQGLEFAREIGSELKTILEVMSEMGKVIIKFRKEIFLVISYVLGKNALLTIIGQLGKVKKALLALKAALAMCTVSATEVQLAMVGMSTSIRAVFAAMMTLHPVVTALGLALTVLATTQLAAAIGQTIKMKKAVSDLKSEMENAKFTDEGVSGIRFTPAKKQAAIKAQQEVMEELLRQRKKYYSKSEAWRNSEEGKSYARKIERTKQQMRDYSYLLEKFERDYGTVYAKEVTNSLKNEVDNRLGSITASYRQEMAKINNMRDEKGEPLGDVEKQKLKLKEERRISKELEQLYEESKKKLDDYIDSGHFNSKYKADIEQRADDIIKVIEDKITLINDKVSVLSLKGGNEIQNWLKTYEKEFTDFWKLTDKMENNPIAGTKVRKQEIKEEVDRSTEFLRQKASEAESTEKALAMVKEEAEYFAKENAIMKENVTILEQKNKLSEKAFQKVQDLKESYIEQAKLAKMALEGGVDFDMKRATLAGNLAKELKKVNAEKREMAKLDAQETLRKYDQAKLDTTLGKYVQKSEDNRAKVYEINAESNRKILDLEIDRVKKSIRYEELGLEERKKAQKIFNEYIETSEQLYNAQHKTALEQTMQDWSRLSDNLSQVWVNAFEGMTDVLIDFAKTGKFSMKDLAENILEDLTRVIIKASMAKVAMQFLNGGEAAAGGPSAMGGGGFFGSVWNSGMNYGMGATPIFHNGGIVGQTSTIMKNYSPEVFANAMKYHSGGLVGLKEDEVPAILQKGEGVFTKDQMAQMSSKPSVTVNVINNTQQDVSAEQSPVRFDGQKMILDVVLRAATTPGAFRDSIRSSLR